MTDDIDRRIAEGGLSWLLVGMGVTNRSVAGALLHRGHSVVAVDDQPDSALKDAAGELGIDLVETPSNGALADLVSDADLVVPAPGLPEHHPVFALAASTGRELIGELDLASIWDDRPVVAITGTNGKTTVVELVLDALHRSGITAVGAGNTDLPLVSAIDDRSTEIFVVEASSFRLAPTTRFDPSVACWLNFAPDHLDIHSDLATYEKAKAAIWARADADTVVVANAADPVVMSHVPAMARVVTFGTESADWRVDDRDRVTGPDGPLLRTDELWRSLPHDIVDSLAAAAIAIAAGAKIEAIAETCRSFAGLSHRVSEVLTLDGSTFFDDSKATTPHATVSALDGFESVVLIAGGRNKGIDLSAMLSAGDHVAAVVAIGEAASDLVRVFGALCPVEEASNMDDAVAKAARLAKGGLPVVLSPGCASFDWYRNYGDRGDDFVRAVKRLEKAATDIGASVSRVDAARETT